MKPTLNFNRIAQRGMTLMETLLVLSVVAFIIVGGLTLYNSASAGARAQRGQQQLIGLASNIRSLFTSSGVYGQLDGEDPTGETLLLQAGAVPDDMIGSSGIINVWNGAVTVSSASNAGACGDGDVVGGVDTINAFCIQFDNMERESCIKILSNGGTLGFHQASANGAAFRLVEDLAGNVAQNNTDCTPEADAGSRVIMHFLFL